MRLTPEELKVIVAISISLSGCSRPKCSTCELLMHIYLAAKEERINELRRLPESE